ncbi:MAG: shikimate kinase AroK [Halofilum sp. (in: g-proteobacteria)]|nr:shikimate kinase AroK [Halofilum sp. (in: g-proteobacteria)]
MTDSASSPGRVFLVGPMGAGKSTIGRLLARRMGLDFLDSDREIEARSGVDIPTIFDFEGETGFRQRERAIIDELTERDGIVLATGGGAVLDPVNRDHLSSRGLTVYLATTVDEQLRRTRHDQRRPLLQTGDRRATLERLQRERDPLYRAAAALVIETDGRRSAATADRLLQRIQTHED